MNSRKRVCLTGFQGFIGRNILKSQSFESNIEIVPFDGNLLQRDYVLKFFRESGPFDTIIHSAGRVEGSIEELLRANVLATMSIVDFAQLFRVPHLIHISSGAVYGESDSLFVSETAPLQPISFYGLSKLYAEDYLRFRMRTGSVSFTILRLPNVFGAESDHGLLARLAADIKIHRKVTVHGDGKQVRQFVHVKDVCNAVALSAQHEVSGCFNIGSQIIFDVNSILEFFREYAKFEVVSAPPENNLRRIVLDWHKAENILSYSPMCSTLDIVELLC